MKAFIQIRGFGESLDFTFKADASALQMQLLNNIISLGQELETRVVCSEDMEEEDKACDLMNIRQQLSIAKKMKRHAARSSQKRRTLLPLLPDSSEAEQEALQDDERAADIEKIESTTIRLTPTSANKGWFLKLFQSRSRCKCKSSQVSVLDVVPSPELSQCSTESRDMAGNGVVEGCQSEKERYPPFLFFCSMLSQRQNSHPEKAHTN